MCCISRYGRYVEGTGSVMQGCVETEVGLDFSTGTFILLFKVCFATFVIVSVLRGFVVCALQMESVFTGLDQCAEDEKLQRLLKLKLRYFTPREVANLMGFPQSFSK